MISIYKYTKSLDDTIELELPKFAQIVHVESQSDGLDDIVSIWALVNPNTEYKEKRKIRIAGTGHPINNESSQVVYINTFTTMNRKLWFHALEIL